MVRVSRLVVMCSAGAISASASPARADDPSHLPPNTPPVAGYYDPATQTFTALADSPSKLLAMRSPSSSTASPTIVHGKLIIKAAVTLDPSIPASATLMMTGAVYIQDSAQAPPTSASYSNKSGAQGTVTRSGSLATGIVSFPFTAVVGAPTYRMQVNVFFYSSVSGAPGLNLQQTIAIPANGSTTTVTFPGAL